MCSAREALVAHGIPGFHQGLPERKAQLVVDWMNRHGVQALKHFTNVISRFLCRYVHCDSAVNGVDGFGALEISLHRVPLLGPVCLMTSRARSDVPQSEHYGAIQQMI